MPETLSKNKHIIIDSRLESRETLPNPNLLESLSFTISRIEKCRYKKDMTIQRAQNMHMCLGTSRTFTCTKHAEMQRTFKPYLLQRRAQILKVGLGSRVEGDCE